MMNVAIFTMLACCVIIIAAAIADWRSFRIPNIFPALLILIFAISKIYLGLSPILWGHIAHFAITLLIGMLLFRFGWIGGGDAKLYAAIALWIPLNAGLTLLLMTVLSGGALAIGYLLNRMSRKRKAANSIQPDGELVDRRIPYGIAIAAGAFVTVMTLGWQNIFSGPPAFDLAPF